MAGGASSAGGDPPDGSGPSGPVTRDEAYWRKLWAFGTSPYGLGLSESALWSLTPIEYDELREVWRDHRQFHKDLYAGLMTVMSRAWFKGEFDPSMFGGKKARPVQIQDYFRQTVEEKKGNLRSMLRAAGAAAEKKKEKAA